MSLPRWIVVVNAFCLPVWVGLEVETGAGGFGRITRTDTLM